MREALQLDHRATEDTATGRASFSRTRLSYHTIKVVRETVWQQGGGLRSAPAAAFAGASLGCLMTLHLVAFGMPPTSASALAAVLLCGFGLYRSRLLCEFFAAAYGGTFTGMTPVLDVQDSIGASVSLLSAPVLLLTSLSGVAFAVVAEIDGRFGGRIAAGFGGRSGAIATVASGGFACLASVTGHDWLQPAANDTALAPQALSLMLAVSALGVVVTMVVLRRPAIAGASDAARTLSAAAIALGGLTLLGLIGAGDAAPDAFYAGCFLGMSSPDRLRGWPEALVGAFILAMVMGAIRNGLPGVGGNLGLAAFVTLALLMASRQFVHHLGSRRAIVVGPLIRAAAPDLRLRIPAREALLWRNRLAWIGPRLVVLATAVSALAAAGWSMRPDAMITTLPPTALDHGALQTVERPATAPPTETPPVAPREAASNLESVLGLSLELGSGPGVANEPKSESKSEFKSEFKSEPKPAAEPATPQQAAGLADGPGAVPLRRPLLPNRLVGAERPRTAPVDPLARIRRPAAPAMTTGWSTAMARTLMPTAPRPRRLSAIASQPGAQVRRSPLVGGQPPGRTGAAAGRPNRPAAPVRTRPLAPPAVP